MDYKSDVAENKKIYVLPFPEGLKHMKMIESNKNTLINSSYAEEGVVVFSKSILESKDLVDKCKMLNLDEDK